MSGRKHQISRRALLKAGAAISVFPAPAVWAQTTEPLRIGFLTVLTGPLAAGGKQQEEGAALFLKERNGMIAGRKVELLTHHSIMECGNQISPQLVSGQLQGGLAMGIGHALHEYLPLYEDGPGNGTWNFNRYRLPRASDVAVWTQTGDVLPPLSETDPPKGVAEVVMIPVVGAIVNGIAHAIGHRFTDLPVTPQKIQEVLA